MRTITHLVVHTAAAPLGLDVSAKQIDAYHKTRGWKMIGYHKVIRKDGSVELGRPEQMEGAGVLGFNATTLHVCCSGNGDISDFTEAQKNALVLLLKRWLQENNLVSVYKRNPMRILGHRECNAILPKEFKTTKTCPGRKVNMAEIRKRVLEAL